MSAALVLWLLSADPNMSVSTVPCKTEADCWLDDSGEPIARPKSKKGRPLPTGSCKNLLWLRNRLACDEADHVCVARHVGDKC